MASLSAFLTLAFERATVVQGLKVALVVGAVLNAINQGDRMLGDSAGDVVWWRIGLTFVVPYCVSVYSSARTRMRFAPGLPAFRGSRLQCLHCGLEGIVVEAGQSVPECPRCGPRTTWRAA